MRIAITVITGLMLAGAAQAQSLPTLNGSFLSPEAPPAFAPDIAGRLDLSPSPASEAAESAAESALAQVRDASDTGDVVLRSGLYKTLMELNGTTRNVRNLLQNTKAAVKLVIIERSGGAPLTAEQEARFNQIADPILRDTETSLIDQIALAQSQTFSESEIRALIAANSSPAAAKYNEGKFAHPEAQAIAIQGYMIDAVVKIVKGFGPSVSG